VDLPDITATNYWAGSLQPEDPDRRPIARRVKEAVGIPVVAVGGARTPALAEQILADGIDVVAVARGLLTDPEFARKSMEHRSHEIYRCIECQPCRYYLGQTCQEEIYRV